MYGQCLRDYIIRGYRLAAAPMVSTLMQELRLRIPYLGLLRAYIKLVAEMAWAVYDTVLSTKLLVEPSIKQSQICF